MHCRNSTTQRDLRAECNESSGRSPGQLTQLGEPFLRVRRMRYPVTPQTEKTMAIQAQRYRARLHVLRDNVQRAKRDVKRKLPGAVERLKAHRATRLAYAENGK